MLILLILGLVLLAAAGIVLANGIGGGEEDPGPEPDVSDPYGSPGTNDFNDTPKGY